MRRLLPGPLVPGNLVTVTLIAIPHSSAGLIEWDCEHALLIANELGRDRPCLGRIRGMAIYPRRLDIDEIRRLSQAAMTRLVRRLYFGNLRVMNHTAGTRCSRGCDCRQRFVRQIRLQFDAQGAGRRFLIP